MLKNCWPKITAEWPNLQRDEMIEKNPIIAGEELFLRVSTNFDGQVWSEEYMYSRESMKYINISAIDHKEIAFEQMERHMRETIEKEISSKVKNMVDQLLNVNPN